MTEPFPPPTPTVTPRPRWYDVPVSRDPDDDALGGVVAGVSRAYGFDVRTTRIAVVLAAIVLFPFVVVTYLAGWLLLPERPAEARSLRAIAHDRRRLPIYVAFGAVAVMFGLGSIGSWFVFGGFPWPLALIAVGILLWAAPGLRSASGEPTATSSAGFAPPRPAPTSPPSEQSVTPQPRHVPITAITVLVVFAGAAITWFGAMVEWWDPRTLEVLIAAGIVLTLGTAASAVVNRSAVLAVPVVVLGLATTAALITQPNLDGGMGQREVVPTAGATEVRSRLALGELTVDARALPSSAAEPVTVAAEVGIGQLRVVVPDDVTLEIDARVGTGALSVDGDGITAGIRQDVQRTIPVDGAAGSMVLEVQVGVGEISIERRASNE